MPFAPVNNINLRYEVTGGGPAVVFLHGLGSSADDWALQVPEFAKQFRVVTLDMRGHGASKARGGYSIEQMADDVAKLLRQLGLPPAHIIGLSMGGCVAIALGIHHAESVRSLALVNTFARYQPPPGGERPVPEAGAAPAVPGRRGQSEQKSQTRVLGGAERDPQV
jgi:pimeloyl-ACP methyl ester carboxylesterase